MPLRVAITGASGRMGQLLMQTVLLSPHWVLVAALDKPDSEYIDTKVSHLVGQESDVVITSQVDQALKIADVLIDFTQPLATLFYLKACEERDVPMVIGTTGFSATQQQLISVAASHIGIVFSPNFSIGINVVLHLLSIAARSLGNDYDIEVLETHHRHKVDAPSGTALKMGQVMAEALQRDLDQCAVYNRHGLNATRDTKTIGFSSMRLGEIVGEHTVWFAAEAERIEITHKADSRQPFAKGALQAAQWLVKQGTGLYTMQDVINQP